MTRQTFLQGTLILVIAGMLTRLLGFVNRLVVARLMGEEGVGLYMMALPTLFLMITLTQIGLPIAISKRVSEATANHNETEVKRIMVISLSLTCLLSIIFTIGLIIVAPLITKYMFTDERTIYPMLALSPAIPLVAITAVLRGYFQGKHNMKPQSYALVIEQIVRISCVAIFVKIALPYGIHIAAAAAMGSVVVGELAALLSMIYQFKRRTTMNILQNFFNHLFASRQTAFRLFSIALPTTGSRIINSIANFFEPIVVSQCLALAGVTTVVATKQYGELMGYVMPLLFLPTFITNSLSISLIPAISEAEAKMRQHMIHFRIHQSIRLSFASGAIATIILILFATPLLNFMYGTPQASKYLTLMAPFYLMLYLQAPLQATLQALDLAKEAMRNSMIGIGVKFLILVILSSHPAFGIMGVSLAMSIHVVLITLLHVATLYKTIQFRLSLIDLLKMVTLIIATWQIGQAINNILMVEKGSLTTLILVIALLTIIYFLLLLILRFIKHDELKQIPLIKKMFQ